ncbi:MAG: hypothetical protein VR72_09275 [Clostridiaceae bacterium BRH_c20a]|nr:MAG: hypothetical protein VR72_09275 [Clostridiaceae bacterium BRH_c20a]
MAKSSDSNIVMRIFITLLGIALILWGVGTIVLGVIGEKDTAVITNVRRQGGERTDGKSGRYSYIVSYTFKLPDGKSIDGYTTKISSGGYVKSPNTITTVRYFRAFPYLNVLEEETKPTLGQLVLVGAGGFLIYAMNSRKIKNKRNFQLRRKI